MKKHRTEPKSILKGEKAHQAILSRLADHPATLEVAQEVTSFFGNHFRYYESEDIDTSEFGLGTEPILALIRLKSGTSRIAQSLAHELLHLRLAVRRFPRYSGIDVPDHLEEFIPALSEYYDPVLNIVQHEIMLPEFLALGFQQRDFLVLPPSPENYKQLVRTPKNEIIPEVRFPFLGGVLNISETGPMPAIPHCLRQHSMQAKHLNLGKPSFLSCPKLLPR